MPDDPLTFLPDPANINRGTQRGHGIIERSVRQRGAGRSGLAAKDGTIIAGNQTLLKMHELGIPIRAVHTTGDEWVVVVRDDLDPSSEDARLLALEDNRAQEVGYDPDPALLAALAQEVDLSGLYYEDELAALLASVAVEPGAGGDDFDTSLQDGPTRTALGDLWAIGPHRLLVGDCTDAANVARLMGGERADACLTDPPYGTASQSKVQKRGERIEVFNLVWDRAAPLGWLAPLSAALCDGAAVVSFWENAGITVLWEAYKEHGIHPLHTVYWNKPVCPQPRPNFCSCVESAVFGRKDGKVRFWGGGGATPNIYDSARAGGNERSEHETQKPLDLWLWLLDKISAGGHLVYDPFAGSGTTIIAAHRTGRRAFGMEIEPRYCDVCLRRAEAEGLSCARVEP